MPLLSWIVIVIRHPGCHVALTSDDGPYCLGSIWKNKMKTMQTIIDEVHQHKRCSERQIRRYMNRFHIKHAGVRQKPQFYPDNAAEIILEKLGLRPAAPEAPTISPGNKRQLASLRIATMSQLRAERAKAQGRAL